MSPRAYGGLRISDEGGAEVRYELVSELTIEFSLQIQASYFPEVGFGSENTSDKNTGYCATGETVIQYRACVKGTEPLCYRHDSRFDHRNYRIYRLILAPVLGSYRLIVLLTFA